MWNFRKLHQANEKSRSVPINSWLVVESHPSEKYDFVSWDDYSQYMEKWKMFQTTKQIEMLHHLRASPFCLSWIVFFGVPEKQKHFPLEKKQITSNQAMLSNVFSNMDCRSQSNYPSMVFPGYPRWVGTEKELIFDIRNLKCEHCVVF